MTVAGSRALLYVYVDYIKTRGTAPKAEMRENCSEHSTAKLLKPDFLQHTAGKLSADSNAIIAPFSSFFADRARLTPDRFQQRFVHKAQETTRPGSSYDDVAVTSDAETDRWMPFTRALKPAPKVEEEAADPLWVDGGVRGHLKKRSVRRTSKEHVK